MNFKDAIWPDSIDDLKTYQKYSSYSQGDVILAITWPFKNFISNVFSSSISKKFFQSLLYISLAILLSVGIESEVEFENRVGFVILLNYFVDEEYKNDIFNAIRGFESASYYANMGLAWLLCVLYVSFPKETFVFLKEPVPIIFCSILYKYFIRLLIDDHTHICQFNFFHFNDSFLKWILFHFEIKFIDVFQGNGAEFFYEDLRIEDEKSRWAKRQYWFDKKRFLIKNLVSSCTSLMVEGTTASPSSSLPPGKVIPSQSFFVLSCTSTFLIKNPYFKRYIQKN